MAARRPIKMAFQEEPTSSQGNNTSYAKPVSRITKENLYIVLALWMEKFPVERVEADPYKKVGAVLVLPNDTIYAVDCTRNGVHAVARLLMAHQDILEDCQAGLCVAETMLFLYEASRAVQSQEGPIFAYRARVQAANTRQRE